MIRAGGFDLVGHMDLVKKNTMLSGGGTRWFNEADCAAGMTAAADALAGTGLPAEVNTGGLNRGLIPETYPGPALLTLLRERGVPAVINADAHRKEDLDGHYADAAKALAAAGYGAHLIFQGRKRGRAVWEREPLAPGNE
jgi:histidinol-phosphatase (PHP family)